MSEKKKTTDRCRQCGTELTPFLNSTKPGRCCLDCEEKGLNKEWNQCQHCGLFRCDCTGTLDVGVEVNDG